MKSRSLKLLLTSNNTYVYCILSIVALLLISPYSLPISIENPYLNGPKLWLYLLTGLTIILVVIKLLSHISESCIKLKLAAPDYLIIFILLNIIFVKYYLYKEIYITDKILVYSCLNILFFLFKYNISSLGDKNLVCFSNTFIGIVFVITLVCVYSGLIQYFDIRSSNNSYFKVTGPFYNPARYANYLGSLLPFSISAIFFFPKCKPPLKSVC